MQFHFGNFAYIFRIKCMLLSHWSKEGHVHLSLIRQSVLEHLKKLREKGKKRPRCPTPLHTNFPAFWTNWRGTILISALVLSDRTSCRGEERYLLLLLLSKISLVPGPITTLVPMVSIKVLVSRIGWNKRDWPGQVIIASKLE